MATDISIKHVYGRPATDMLEFLNQGLAEYSAEQRVAIENCACELKRIMACYDQSLSDIAMLLIHFQYLARQEADSVKKAAYRTGPLTS